MKTLLRAFALHLGFVSPAALATIIPDNVISEIEMVETLGGCGNATVSEVDDVHRIVFSDSHMSLSELETRVRKGCDVKLLVHAVPGMQAHIVAPLLRYQRLTSSQSRGNISIRFGAEGSSGAEKFVSLLPDGEEGEFVLDLNDGREFLSGCGADLDLGLFVDVTLRRFDDGLSSAAETFLDLIGVEFQPVSYTTCTP